MIVSGGLLQNTSHTISASWVNHQAQHKQLDTAHNYLKKQSPFTLAFTMMGAEYKGQGSTHYEYEPVKWWHRDTLLYDQFSSKSIVSKISVLLIINMLLIIEYQSYMCMWPTMTTWKIKSRDKAALIYVCKVKLNGHDIHTNITMDLWKFWYFDFSNRYFNMLKRLEVWPYLAHFSSTMHFWLGEWKNWFEMHSANQVRRSNQKLFLWIKSYFGNFSLIVEWCSKGSSK